MLKARYHTPACTTISAAVLTCPSSNMVCKVMMGAPHCSATAGGCGSGAAEIYPAVAALATGAAGWSAG